MANRVVCFNGQFSFGQIKFVCIDVAICDIVHNVETVFNLC